jgi:type IV pilus assembly protein PilA
MSLLARQGRTGLVAKGFTLVELMIVVAIIGVLSAIAIPNFVGAQKAAKAGARIGEALGFSKECSVKIVTGVGSWTAEVKSGTSGSDGVETKGTCAEGGTGSVEAFWPAGAVGVKCLNQVTTTTHSKAVISVSSQGTVSCVLS